MRNHDNVKFTAQKVSPRYLYESTGCMVYNILCDMSKRPIGRLLDYSKVGGFMGSLFIAEFQTNDECGISFNQSTVHGDDRNAVLHTFSVRFKRIQKLRERAFILLKNLLEEKEKFTYSEYIDSSIVKMCVDMTIQNARYSLILSLSDTMQTLYHQGEEFHVNKVELINSEGFSTLCLWTPNTSGGILSLTTPEIVIAEVS